MSCRRGPVASVLPRSFRIGTLVHGVKPQMDPVAVIDGSEVYGD